MKKVIFFVNIVSFVIVLNGCTFTGMLHEKKHCIEEVSSIMVSEDYNNIVVLSSKYHYIFNAPPVVIATLKSSFSSKVNAYFSAFYVDESNNIAGTVTLTLERFALTDNEIEYARNAGYRRQNKLFLSNVDDLKGIRYVSGTSFESANSYELDSDYSIEIFEPASAAGKTARVLLTPITLTADGVLNLGRILLIPIGIVLLGIVGP